MTHDGMREIRMITDLFWLAIFAGSMMYLIGQGCKKLLCMISPRYESKCERKQKERVNRSIARSCQKKADRKARALKWAHENPEDPDAKRLIDEAAAEAEQAARTAALLSTPATDDVSQNPLEILRRRQHARDDYMRREKEREEAEALLTQQLLEYALANPTTPETVRHLRELREKAVDDLGRADHEVHHCEYMLKMVNDLEKIEYATCLDDATARKEAAERRVREIGNALESASSSTEQ